MNTEGTAGPLDDLRELALLDAEIDKARDLAALKPVFYRVSAITQRNPEDAGVQASAARVKEHLIAHGMRLKQEAAQAAETVVTTPAPPPEPVPPAQWRPAPAPASPPEPAPAVPAAAEAPPEPVAGTSPLPASPAVSFSTAAMQAPAYEPPPPEYGAPPLPPPAYRRRMPAWQRALLIGGIAGLVLAAGAILVLRKFAPRVETPGKTSFSFEVITSPPGASIQVNGAARCTSNCRLDLSAGSYQIQAFLSGYEPAATSVNVGAGTPLSITLALQPAGLPMRLFTDLDAGSVTIDDKPAGDLQDGQFVLDRVQPGKHVIRIAGRGAESSFTFDAGTGQAPVLSGSISAKNVFTAVVITDGSGAHVRTSVSPLKVALDGQPPRDAGPEGIDFKGLGPGDHNLTFGEGSQQRKIVFNSGAGAALTAFVKLDQNAGTLVVMAGEDDVQVFLNGKEYRRRTRGGQLRIPSVAVKEHTIRIAKEGFQEEPEQRVAIRKGEESRVEFKLRPVPRLAVLHIRGGQPGTEVLIDGQVSGTVAQDGTLSVSGLNPGDRTIELRRQRHAPKQLKRQFRAGETVEFGAGETNLERLPATLRLSISPADARVTIRAAGESQARPVTETTLRLSEGSYVVKATSPNYIDRSASFDLAAGESKTLDLKLTLEVVAAPLVKPLGMGDWEEPAAWQANGRWMVRKGGNFVFFRPGGVRGTFAFTVTYKGRRLQWFANHRDGRNYALFQLDRKHFYSKDVVNGRSFDLSRVPHNLDSKDNSYALQVEIGRESIVHRILRDGQWVVLDAWSHAGREFSAGRFGFLIPGGDEVGLAGFSFTPK